MLICTMGTFFECYMFGFITIPSLLFLLYAIKPFFKKKDNKQ